MRRTILLGSSNVRRLAAWGATIRRRGDVVLPAQTVGEALEWVHTVCPDLVLAEADLADGRAVAVLRALRRTRALAGVPVVVQGTLTRAERRTLAHDQRAWVAPDVEAETLIRLPEMSPPSD